MGTGVRPAAAPPPTAGWPARPPAQPAAPGAAELFASTVCALHLDEPLGVLLPHLLAEGAAGRAQAVDDLGLSPRARNCLRRGGWHRLGDLSGVTGQRLLEERGVGESVLHEVLRCLARATPGAPPAGPELDLPVTCPPRVREELQRARLAVEAAEAAARRAEEVLEGVGRALRTCLAWSRATGSTPFGDGDEVPLEVRRAAASLADLARDGSLDEPPAVPVAGVPVAAAGGRLAPRPRRPPR